MCDYTFEDKGLIVGRLRLLQRANLEISSCKMLHNSAAFSEGDVLIFGLTKSLLVSFVDFFLEFLGGKAWVCELLAIFLWLWPYDFVPEKGCILY